MQFGSITELGIALTDLADDLATWSQETFGTDAERGPLGALRHLEKEAREAQDWCGTTFDGNLHEELADCLLLVLDASRRAGLKPHGLIRVAQAKMKVNRQRSWPKPTSDMPVEHIRE